MTRNASAMRSIKAMTLSPMIAREDRARKDRDERLQELSQQFQIPISGRANVDGSFTPLQLDFDFALLDAPDQRESHYSDPLVTYGVMCDANIFVACNVVSYIRDGQRNFIGAKMNLGIFAPKGERVPFKGAVHVNFSGFGAPDFNDETED